MIQVPAHLTAADRKLSRAHYNTVLDAVKELQGGGGGSSEPWQAGLPGVPGQLLVSAVSDEDVKMGDILAPAGRLLPDPATEYVSSDLRVEKAAADAANVLVALDAFKAGEVGLAVISGLAWCEVDIQDAKHQFVRVGEDGKAVSCAAGGWGRIIHPLPEKEKAEEDAPDNGTGGAGAREPHPGTGTHSCLVRFPNGGAGEARFGVVTERPSGDGGPCLWRPAVIDANGDWTVSMDGDPQTAIAPRLN